MSCPFMPDKEHQDTPDSDDRIDFTKTAQPARVPVPKAMPDPRATVGVREPRRDRPGSLVRAVALRGPTTVTRLPDVVSKPLPETGRTQIGEVTAGSASITVRSIMREAQKSIGRAPAKATFTKEDDAFLRQLKVFKGSLSSTEVRSSDAIQSQMAEEAAAEALSPAEGTQIEVLRELVRNPPAGLIAIPLVAEAFRRLRQSKTFRSGLPIRTGSITKGDLSPRSTPLTVRTESRAPSGPGQMSEARGAIKVPQRAGGGGGFTFNAAERMRQMVGRSRQMVAEM